MPEIFLDSNVLLYLLATDAVRKHGISLELVSGSLRNEYAIISTQVLQECLNIFTRHRLMTFDQAREWLKIVMPICRVFPSEPLYSKTLDLLNRLGLGFYDSCIVAAALAAGCNVLVTEDLQHDQLIEGLRVTNPFR